MTYEPDLLGDFHHKYASVDPITGLPIKPEDTMRRLRDLSVARRTLQDPDVLSAARYYLETCLRLR